MLKNLVKEAVIEALVEFMNQGVAVAADDEDQLKDDDGKEEAPENDNSSEGTSGENTGSSDGDKKKEPIRPKPNFGIGGFSLRN